jgi:hypothetical protein
MPTPTDVAPLVTGDNYDAVIPVTSDTSVLTEAELTDTAVALGNRIEFIRKALPEISDSPEAVVLVRDDFIGTHYNSPATASKFIHSEQQWVASETGTVVVNYFSTSKNPGNLNITTPGDAASNIFHFELMGVAQNIFTFQSVQSMTWVLKVTGNAANVTARSTVGLFENVSDPFGTSTNSLCIVGAAFAGLVNWRVLSRKASVSTFTDVLAFVSGEYAVFHFKRNAGGDMELYANGALVHTVLAANLPVGDCTLGGVCSDNSGDVAPTLTAIDFVAVRGDTTPREGA